MVGAGLALRRCQRETVLFDRAQHRAVEGFVWPGGEMLSLHRK